MSHPPATTTEEVEPTSLDDLIPPPMGTTRRLALGAVLVVIAAAITVGHLGGWFLPRPTDGAAFSSDAALQVDTGRGLVGARVLLPNFSRRTVRVTNVSLDAPGAELVSVQVVPGNARASAGTDGPDSHTESGRLEPAGRRLPVEIDPGEQASLILWLRPEQCDDLTAPWGVATATVDFGDGAFPPVTRRIVLRQDPIWEGEPARASSGSDADHVGDGPLALACEVLR